MTIHRIDFACDLLGPIRRVCGAVARFAERTVTPDGGTCEPSDVDDWSCLIGEFQCGAVGVWEGTTLAKGYGLSGFGRAFEEPTGLIITDISLPSIDGIELIVRLKAVPRLRHILISTVPADKYLAIR